MFSKYIKIDEKTYINPDHIVKISESLGNLYIVLSTREGSIKIEDKKAIKKLKGIL